MASTIILPGIAMRYRYVPFVALVLFVGCSKIHDQRTFVVEAGGSHNVKISAPLSDQKLKIVMTSDQPVNIYVILDKHIPQGKDDLDPETMKEGVLAKEKGKKEADLSVNVPAKENFRLFLNGAAKNANVTLKIDSQ